MFIFVEIFFEPNQFLPLIQLVTILKIDLHAKFEHRILIGSRVMAKKRLGFFVYYKKIIFSGLGAFLNGFELFKIKWLVV